MLSSLRKVFRNEPVRAVFEGPSRKFSDGDLAILEGHLIFKL